MMNATAMPLFLEFHPTYCYEGLDIVYLFKPAIYYRDNYNR